MNFKVVLYVLGGLLRLLGLLMIVPLGVAYYYGESLTPFLVSIFITTLTGFLLLSYKPKKNGCARRVSVLCRKIGTNFCSEINIMSTGKFLNQ